MTPTLLRAVGEALYGDQWQTPLADALGVNLRSLQRWAAGTSTPSSRAMPGIIADLRRLVDARGRDLARLAAQLDRAALQYPPPGKSAADAPAAPGGHAGTGKPPRAL